MKRWFNNKTEVVAIVLIVLSGFFLYQNLFGKGIPATHDGPMHLVRMINYYIAIKQGQLPPRIGPHLANNLGYPVFNYNYPLGWMAAVPFIIINLDYDLVYQLVIISFILVGAIGWYKLFNHHGLLWWQSVFGSVLFLVNPYLIQLVFVRGNIGEIAALCLISWVLWQIGRFGRERSLAQGISLGIIGGIFLLSHNVLVWLSSPFLLLYVIYTAYQSRFFSPRWLIPLFVAFALSAFFWLPALGEKSFTVLGDSPVNHDYQNHFVYFHQLVNGPFGYGYSQIGPVDGMSFNFSVIELVFVGVTIGTLCIQKKLNFPLFVLILGVGLPAFLSLNISQRIWDYIPMGYFVQFPWRILWISHVFLVILSTYLARNFKLNTILALIIFILIISRSNMRATSRDVRSNEAWFTSGETTSTVNENLPKDFNLIGAYELERTIFNQDNVWTSDNTAKVKINSWNGSKRKYEIQVATQSAVVERSAYFPGWQVWVDGKLVKIDNQDPWNYGLLSYTVDPGEHYIVSKFTQNTFWRKLGNSLTLAAITGIVFFYIKKLIIK